ncbi:MAG TPA: hybrid sensor histidine kinase/response regulator [Roseiflexaceae bacterium]|nr:hybrid sensor histidine kinase/response regulator [Roseiflexaceae bacterium]
MQPAESVNILLVDDHPGNLLALEAILKPLGHTLVMATSGEEALKRLLQHDFAAILLDVHMPVMDGFETAELIRGRERSQDTPIIFLTAVNTSDTHMFRGYSVGAVDYLLKPFVPAILVSKVTVLVDLYKKTRKVQLQARQLEATIEELKHQIDQRQRGEAALRQAHDVLEQRVRERTANLATANEALRAEIAERQRVEEERARLLVREQQARVEAEAAVRLRDQFLSIASHELKTPLTTLLGNTQLLRRRVAREGGLSQRNQQALGVVEQQATRLKKLIEALLDISRIQNGQLTIARQWIDLNALASRMVREVQPILHQHTIEFSSTSAPLLIEGDELRLEQVLQNIIQNAVKYSPSGGMITVRTEAQNSHACVSVSDQGIGIPQSSLGHLFERFYRAENAEAQHISGMGVGLYLVKEIVGLHGGAIEVSSTEGAGSTFTIRLPCREVPAEAPQS